MMKSNEYKNVWKCSCKKENSIAIRKCSVCGDEIPKDLSEMIYKDEIERQKIDYASEEKKRKIIIEVIAAFVLISIPIIICIMTGLLGAILIALR